MLKVDLIWPMYAGTAMPPQTSPTLTHPPLASAARGPTKVGSLIPKVKVKVVVVKVVVAVAHRTKVQAVVLALVPVPAPVPHPARTPPRTGARTRETSKCYHHTVF